MQTVNLSSVSASDRELAATIAARAKVNLRDCYQCGKCSAGCPMASEMDATPQQIMHMLQMGLVDKALSSKGPWICAQCMTCSARCPQNIDICAIMREVRRESHAQGKQALRDSDVFETSFINGLRKNGVSNEQYLAVAYNFKSGHLMQDVISAPGMFVKGVIGIAHHKSAGHAEVGEIVEKCLGEGEGE